MLLYRRAHVLHILVCLPYCLINTCIMWSSRFYLFGENNLRGTLSEVIALVSGEEENGRVWSPCSRWGSEWSAVFAEAKKGRCSLERRLSTG